MRGRPKPTWRCPCVDKYGRKHVSIPSSGFLCSGCTKLLKQEKDWLPGDPIDTVKGTKPYATDDEVKREVLLRREQGLSWRKSWDGAAAALGYSNGESIENRWKCIVRAQRVAA